MDYKRGRPKLVNPGHRVQMVIDEEIYQYLVKISRTVIGARPTELCSKIVTAWVQSEKQKERGE